VVALQDIVKMAKYHKRCFDQIEPTFNENKELAAEVDRLCEKLKATEKEKAKLETS
jgi:predicted nuclease with TOPRIM domain